MNAHDVARLFVVLAGYWPGSAPDPEDPVAVAAHLDLLGHLDLDVAKGAARYLAFEERREFCPPPGVIAGVATPSARPERAPVELEPAPADALSPEQQAANVARVRGLLADIGRGMGDDGEVTR